MCIVQDRMSPLHILIWITLIITDPLGSSWCIPSSEESGDISNYVHTMYTG